MSKLAAAKQKIAVALSPKLFAFGGGTKPVSQLLFNKYDTDQSGLYLIEKKMNEKSFSLFKV